MQAEMALDIRGDRDTFEGVFGHLARGYVIEVNGLDMVCQSTSDGGVAGLYGYVYQVEREDGLDFDPDQPVGFEWDEIERVVIY